MKKQHLLIGCVVISVRLTFPVWKIHVSLKQEEVIAGGEAHRTTGC